jgi:hypothetical protein
MNFNLFAVLLFKVSRATKLLSVLLLLLPAAVQAQDAYSTNADGSIYTYRTNADGTANIVAYAGPPWVVTIPTNINGLTVTSIGTNAFENNTTLTSVTIPGSVTSIGEDAFGFDNSLTNATIDNGVISIGDSAFVGDGMTSVTIPGSVISIGDGAFVGDGLTSVTIPTNVTSIGYAAFTDCYSLSAITVDTNNPAYSSPNGVLFDKSQATLIEYPDGLGGSYTIPNSVTNIGDDAFADCTRLTSVTIPNSVTSIGEDAFAYVNLTSVMIPDSVTTIGADAFAGCAGVTNLTIGNSVTSIGDYAFYNFPRLTSVTIPNSVTNIGQGAFEGCGLTSVTIPNSVTSIEADAFSYSYSLTSVYFTGNAPSPNNDSTVFSGNPNGDPATVYYLPGTTGWGAMFDYLPTAPWFLPNPLILNREPNFGVAANGFGFTISWATNVSVVVEAATNLASPVWLPVSINTLTGGTNYFSDPQWTNYPVRFYRAALAFTVGGTLTGLPAGDTVTLQDNGSDNLTMSTNGTFTFPTALPNGHAYSVTVSGTSGGTSIQMVIYPPVTANSSGTISGANVTNVAVQCTPIYTGNLDVDMYNAAVADGTANGGVPGVMLTENGGPSRVTALGLNSDNVAEIYSGRCKYTQIVGTGSCSSTTFPSGTWVIQFGTTLECGFGPYGY